MLPGQADNQPLNVLVGHQLSSVEFVQDYVQLHFDGPTITAITRPEVNTNDTCYHWASPGYRDILCSCIAQRVRRTLVIPEERLELEFLNGIIVSVSLRREDLRGRSAEAAHFTSSPECWWVW